MKEGRNKEETKKNICKERKNDRMIENSEIEKKMKDAKKQIIT